MKYTKRQFRIVNISIPIAAVVGFFIAMSIMSGGGGNDAAGSGMAGIGALIALVICIIAVVILWVINFIYYRSNNKKLVRNIILILLSPLAFSAIFNLIFLIHHVIVREPIRSFDVEFRADKHLENLELSVNGNSRFFGDLIEKDGYYIYSVSRWDYEQIGYEVSLQTDNIKEFSVQLFDIDMAQAHIYATNPDDNNIILDSVPPLTPLTKWKMLKTTPTDSLQEVKIEFRYKIEEIEEYKN